MRNVPASANLFKHCLDVFTIRLSRIEQKVPVGKQSFGPHVLLIAMTSVYDTGADTPLFLVCLNSVCVMEILFRVIPLLCHFL